MDRKDWGAAIDSFRQAITIAIELAEKDKDNSEWHERLAQARDKLAAADTAGRRPARGERDQGSDAIALAAGPRGREGAQRDAQSA